MKPVKDFVILALAIAVVAAAYFAWHEHRRYVSSREQAIAPNDYAGLQKRLAESEERLRELNRQLAARSEHTAASSANGRRGLGGLTGGDRGPGADIRALMDQPEMQRLRALQQKTALDGRFATLFKDLKLPPGTLDKLKDLLVEKEVTMQDMMAVARDHGIDPRVDPDGFRELAASAQNETDGAIKSLIGSDAFAQYQQYQQTLPQRTVINQLQQSLSYTGEPLSDSQAASLIQILASSSASAGASADAPLVMTFGPPPGSGPGPGLDGGGPGQRALITPEAVTLAQTVLSASQVQVLQQLQQSQQAQEQLFRTLRDNLGGGGPGPR